ncbi:NYN domain-containing protein [Demequina sp.]|uniref:NYN domain-containing protein n=1 Tax=Demequina sp. TaxID=2050685 RepID=UPI003A8C70AC
MTTEESRTRHTATATPRRVRSRRAMRHDGRRLILIDVENLLGCEPRDADAALFEVAIEGVLARVAFRAGTDQVVIGACPQSAVKVFGVRAPHRLVVREGASGADRALVAAAADHDHTAARFDEVVIASGDREFLETAVQLRARGVRTTVASRADALNGSVRIVADEVVALDSARELGGLALAA